MKKPITKTTRNIVITAIIGVLVIIAFFLTRDIPAPVQEIEKEIPYDSQAKT